MLTALKGAAKWLIYRGGLSRAIARLNHPTTVILSYHNIVPVGEVPAGDLSLHLPREDFSRQLDFLLKSHDVVPLTEALESQPVPESRPRAVITFDDAYVGTMTAGIEELVSRELPATVFVPPALLGRRGFWWDLLSGPEAPLDLAFREHCLTGLEGRQDRILAWAAEEGLRMQPLPEHARPADEATLREAANNPLVTLGNHTWSHANLAVLDPDEMQSEVDRGRAWLRFHVSNYVDFLAYPYGRFQEETIEGGDGTAQVGLMNGGGASEIRGRRIGYPDRIPRINMPTGLTLAALSLRLAGMWG